MAIHYNTSGFKAELKQISRQMDVNFSIVMRAFLLTLHRAIVMRTPVRTGRAAGSWSISMDQPGRFMIPDGAYSSKEEAITRASNLQISNPYAKWFIYNNVPYIDWLEYGYYPDGPLTVSGFSRQAPEGMLRLSVVEIAGKLEALAKNVLR